MFLIILNLFYCRHIEQKWTELLRELQERLDQEKEAGQKEVSQIEIFISYHKTDTKSFSFNPEVHDIGSWTSHYWSLQGYPRMYV
jgi:hypothetical protein